MKTAVVYFNSVATKKFVTARYVLNKPDTLYLTLFKILLKQYQKEISTPCKKNK